MPSLYEALHVDSSVAEAELRSAYRQQAFATHPRQGGRGGSLLRRSQILCDAQSTTRSYHSKPASPGCSKSADQDQKGSRGKLQRGEEGQAEEAAQ